MSKQTKKSAFPAPLRAIGALLSFATGIVLVPAGIYFAFTLEPGAIYFMAALGGACSFLNGVWITQGLLRERAERA